MNLFPKLFPSTALRSEISRLTAERDDLMVKNTNLWKSNTEANEIIGKQRAELEKVMSSLRDQTDADLMLVSARILFAIAQNKKPEQADVVLQQSLMAQQQAMGARNSPMFYGGPGGLAALSGLFPR